jgi:hypothetical protein
MFPDWAWTERFPGLTVDKPGRWTLCGLFTPVEKPVCGLNEDLDYTRARLARGQYVFVDCSRTWIVRGHGLSEDMACTRPNRVHGLSVATDTSVANIADIARMNRDFFTDIRALWLQGVRRPLSNPQA